jgi:ATP-dependent 26S proteasome regulatory subunit
MMMKQEEKTILLKNPASNRYHANAFPDAKFKGLDDQWIDDIIYKRKSYYSTVLIVETGDPLRWHQIENYFTHSKDNAESQVYLFDMWGGLRMYEKGNEKWSPVRPKASNAGYEEVANTGKKLTDLRDVLHYMDKQLKSEESVLILRWLDAPDDASRIPYLSYALRSWAFDPEVLGKHSTIILVAADTAKAIDEATVEVLAWSRAPLPQENERKHIINYSCGMFGVEKDQPVSDLVRATAGLNLHQLESVLLETWHRKGAFDFGVVKDLKTELIKRSELVEVQEPDESGFESVGGYEAVKAFIKREIIQVLTSKNTRVSRFGVSLPRGILFFGPPGTGKTLLAKALAKETRLPFINLRTENLYSKWLGESGKRFSQAILLCEQMSPALVFVDEIDRFGKRSGGGADGASQESGRVFSQVLEWLGDQNRKSLVVGTTNEPEHLDDAFLREGRFDYKIPILYPNHAAREEILRIHLGLTGAKPQMPWEFSSDEMEALVKQISAQTEGFTGAEIEQICLRSRRNGLNSQGDFVTLENVLDALRSFRIDRNKREEVKQHHLELAAEYTNDSSFLKSIEDEK